MCYVEIGGKREACLSNQYDEISKLYELYSSVSKHIELDDIIKATKSIIVNILHVDVVGIHLYNSKKDKLKTNYIFGLSEKLSKAIEELNAIDSLTGVILKDIKPLFFSIDDYPETKYKSIAKSEGIKNMGIFPILYEDDIMGLMFIANKSDDMSYINNEGIIQSFCSELGSLIKNSLLYSKIKDELSEKSKQEIDLIKAREKMEESKKVLEDSFTNLDLMFKNLEAVIWRINKKGEIVTIEGRALNELGIHKNELIGMSIQVFHKRNNKALECAKHALGGKYCEYEAVLKDRLFHVKYSPIYGCNKTICGAVAVAMDVTNIRIMEKRLFQNETRFKLASEGARIGWWDWDIKNDKFFVDNHLAGFVGYTFEELQPLNPRSWNRFIYDEDVEKSKKLLKSYFRGEIDYYECELRVTHRDGSLKWILNRGKIIERDSSSSPIRMYGVYIDITETKKAAEIELLLTKKEEEEKIRNEFFANISHELRTPINVIYSAVQLEDKYIANLDKDQLLKYNKTIRQNCLRLVKMTNNIIDITRVETGFFNPIFKIENIVQLIEDITLSIISYACMKNITVTFDTEMEEIYVNCDSNLIERIVLNLLSNSVKYGNEGGFIQVYIRKDKNNMVNISIKDDGIGIPKDLQNKIFERFQRVDNGFSRNNEGSGIGLSIVKSLVEIQGGTIELNSALNEGSEFIIKFEAIEGNEYDLINMKSENHIIEKVDVEFSDIYI